jgi:hypothetical protein
VKLHLQYHSEKTQVAVDDRSVDVKPYQIIVWISILTDDFEQWHSGAPRVPAILDTGNNHNFAITEQQLVHWAGIHSTALAEVGHAREAGRRVKLCDATVWLHGGDNQPMKLTVAGGVAVYEGSWPRLPILGLRALTNSNLQVLIYGDTKRAVLRTPPPWYWPF